MLRRISLAGLIASCCLALLAPASFAETRALFATQQQGSTGMQKYEIDLDTGALTAQGSLVPSGSLPSVPGISPDGSKLYVGAYGDNEVHGFSIGPGGLAALSGSPYASGFGPNEAVVSSSGNTVWTADATGGTVTAFAVDGAGELSQVAGSPFAASAGVNALASSPMHSLLYGSGYYGDEILGYLTQPNGALTPGVGFPLAHTGTPADVEYNVAGSNLFVANNADDNVSSYSIDALTGGLTEVAGSPFPAGDGPAATGASPDGKWLFVLLGFDNAVQPFSIGADGSLTPVGGQVPTGAFPYDITVTPDSRFAYVANYNDGTISGYSIGSNGMLTELSGSPFGNGSGASASFAIVPDQGPIAAFTSGVKDNTVSFNAAGSSDPDGSVASYVWNFGDGTSASTTSPQTSHTYPAAGNFEASLRVVDNENCSNVQVGTGQTIACNGSALAVESKGVTAIGPLTLKHATGKQLTTKKVTGGIQRRVQVEFFLNRAAEVTYQFQKSSSKGRCRKTTTKKKGKAKYRNFGKKANYPGNLGRVRRTFVGDFGGKTIVPGRYRVQLRATAPDSDATPTITSASFCVR